MTSGSRVFLMIAALILPFSGSVFAQFDTVISIPPDADPGTIESDTQLNLLPFGSIGSNFDAGEFNGMSENVEVNIMGGAIEDFFTANRGSTINVNGGLIGDFFNARVGSDVNINSGTVGDFFNAADGCDVTISGGTVGSKFAAFFGSTVTIAGGQIGDYFLASSDSLVNLVGQSFELRDIETGSLIQDLTSLMQPGTPFPLTNRDVALTGILADGTAFEFDLYSVYDQDQDFFAEDVDLRLNLAIVATADALDVFRGITVSGGLSEILISDDSRLVVEPGFTINNDEAPVWLVLDGTLPVGNANALLLSVESQAGTPGLTGTIEAWNWTTSSYDVLQSFEESFNTDSIESANLSGNTSEYIQSGTNAVRARIGWRQTGFVLNFPWQVRVDQIGWAIH